MSRNVAYDDALRRGILTEASERMRDAGPEGLSLRSLATSQGTSTTAVYTMFGGKNGLLAAVGAEADSELAAAQRQVLGGRGPLEDLRMLARAYRLWAVSNPGLYDLVIRERHTPHDALLEVVDALVDEGIFRNAPIVDVASSVWASLHGIVALEIAAWPGAPSSETYFEMQVTAVMRSWLLDASAADRLSDSRAG